ncbi:Type III pantothenate kinase [Paraburkholderia hiiakae]|uniref:Type III pantothenate kinase n=1 Tax=Paraburkholderia hiiakae TaxID=1081782 RepID=A0ABN7HF30_9BURK|nr:type III pantothenate kinase [Paraburkholderia hiiakae]CAD6513418.1 Type III pantothenate kinase [Paraburkholderia hiiakae]
MSRGPLLLIDAGNSRIKWALVAPDGSRLHAGAMDHVRDDGAQSTRAAREAGWEEWAALPRPAGAWISNVAGAAVGERLDALVEAHWPGLSRTVVRACAQQCGVTNSYATPDALGSDRWAGMIGAHAAYPGEPLLIATFGTATTLEALRADGTFVGGMIAPGFTLMMRSLGEHTAQLPVVAGGMANAAHPGIAFATDTRSSISAGCALAQAALVERALADLQDAWRIPVRLVVSGGAAAEVTAALKVPHTRHDALVLAGLALIAAQC